MKNLLILLLIVFTSLTASAKWAPLPLKSLVEHSNCIVIAEFVSEDSRKTEGARIDQIATLKVTSIIKGEAPANVIVSGFQGHICAPQFIFPTTKGQKYLLFLHKSENSYSVLNGHLGAMAITDNKVNWFTDETEDQYIGQRKSAKLDVAIAAIKRAISP